MHHKTVNLSVVALSGAFLLLTACKDQQPAPPAQTPPPAQVAPAAPAVPTAPVQAAAPAAPPATPLIPVDDTPPAVAPITAPKSTGAGAGIDKAIPGKETSGDELIGNYACAVDSKQLSLGPFKVPPFGCKIFRSGDGSLKIASSAEGAGSFKGSVANQTAAGFFVNARYEVAGNSLVIKARMTTAGAGKYAGRGRGRFNDDKSNQINYKLTMTRK